MSERLRLGARCGLDERVEQADESVYQFPFPDFECRSEACAFFEVEFDQSAGSDGYELGDDRFKAGHGLDLPEKPFAFDPGDLDDVARDVDVHLIEPASFHFKVSRGAANA